MFGPPGFIDRVEHKLNAYTWNLVGSYAGKVVLEAYEVNDLGMVQHARFESLHTFERERMPEFRMEDDVLAFCGPLRVRCAVLDHGTPCLGFALEEPVHVNIWKTRLDELGLDVGSWLRDLKRAVLEGLPDATPIRALRRSGGRPTPTLLPLGALSGAVQTVPGQRFAYIVDIRNHDENTARVQRLAFGADILFIECPFLESDAEHAAQRNHLTACQAGLLARGAQVARLVPCHFSPRYSDRPEMLREEAERAFHG